jgi:hypothetical protein
LLYFYIQHNIAKSFYVLQEYYTNEPKPGTKNQQNQGAQKTRKTRGTVLLKPGKPGNQGETRGTVLLVYS